MTFLFIVVETLRKLDDWNKTNLVEHFFSWICQEHGNGLCMGLQVFSHIKIQFGTSEVLSLALKETIQQLPTP